MSDIAVNSIAEHQQRWTGTDFLKNMWREACDGLSIIIDDESGPTIAHEVSIGLVPDPEGGVRTQFRVALDTAVATRFSMTRKTGGRMSPSDETVADRFDDIVSVEAEDLELMEGFLTDERKAVFSQLMLRFPSAKITNSYVATWAKGVDPDRDKTERTVDRLIEVAEVSRPSWIDVALDERSVLSDLFNNDLDQTGLAERFETLYRGSEVAWFGEVLQIGATDHAGQRAAVLIGSADGRTMTSGRVVALVALDASLGAVPGDVVAVNGSLWNLDPRKRLFHIE